MKKILTSIGALFLFVFLISACVPGDPQDPEETILPATDVPSVEITPTPANPRYDGFVFVRVTDAKLEAWRNAGWKIDENERGTDILLDNPEYPPDCTLYLLPYYPDTRVGYCISTVENPVEIPIDGTWDQVWVVVNGVNVYLNPPTPVPSGN